MIFESMRKTRPEACDSLSACSTIVHAIATWHCCVNGSTRLRLTEPFGHLLFFAILTPLAAVGLIIEMIGATLFVILFYGVAPVAFPVVTGLLLAFVAYGCWLRLKTVSSDGLRNFRHVSIR
jgi:hypothetical protein